MLPFLQRILASSTCYGCTVVGVVSIAGYVTKMSESYLKKLVSLSVSTSP